ncbi:MAG: LysM peptidoglycan-binding domain-containing protein, partial [Candidatus Methylomirabilales bacterium]
PVVPPSPLNKMNTSPDDPLLTEAQELLRQAQRQAEHGHDHEAMTLLTQARALMLSDGAVLTEEAATRRDETLAGVEALSEELAAIQAMTATPSEGEAALVSPEDAEVLEQALPEIPTPTKPEIAYDIPVEMNPQVQAYIELFTTERQELIAAALERSGRYLPLMRQIFAEKALPQDLVNLAYIESAFKLYAYSRARAVGIWQFIKGTARKYGLKTNWWVDERRDPTKATAAAADYLSDLHTIFQSWPLAIAAYNAGEGKVLRAIQRQGTTDFWKLKLPRETRLFVPAFMAMTIIAKDPERYGFDRPIERPWQVEQVALPQPTNLRFVAKAIGVTTEELRKLNPELNRLVTPPQEGYRLNLPPGTQTTFLAALTRLPQARRVAWRQYRIRRGETLSGIAQRYRTTVAVLMEMNRLKNPHRIRAGARLSVPVPAPTHAETSRTIRFRNRRASSYYVVKPGDSLWEIARAHRVSTRDLKRWNNLRGSLIRPGRTLRIYSK